MAAEDISVAWRRRAAVLLLCETPLSDVIGEMSADGIAESDAAAMCARLFADPAFDAARWAMGHLGKLEAVLDARNRMAALSEASGTVQRRKGLTAQEFLEEHYAANRPVVLEDLCDEWPARELWSPQYLLEAIGDVEVEVMAGRDEGNASDVNVDDYRTKMSFADYVSRVLATEWSNSFYLVANNKLLSDRAGVPLWKDFTLDKRYLRADRLRKRTFLWFGPGGTVTSLHHDILNVMFHQVDGWKHFILFSPLESHLLGNSKSVYSDIDPLRPDLDRFPRFAEATPLHITLGPGEALFIPVGWWHHVTALETSISLSTTSFPYPNRFDWVHPFISV